MPAPVQNIFTAPPITKLDFAVEPAHSAIHSLVLLTRTEEFSGFSEWVTHTFELMTAKERQRNYLVMIGLFYAVLPRRSWSSFPAYLENLQAQSPQTLRDKLLSSYASLPVYEFGAQEEEVDFSAITANEAAYLAFLKSRFPPEVLDEDLEVLAYSYVTSPEEMKALIINHLQYMWQTYLAPEWERVEPMLRDAVRAFQQVDYSELTRVEAVKAITGQVVDNENWCPLLDEAERVVFVPHPHVGPYVAKILTGNTAVILYGARLPAGAKIEAPDLSRTEIMVRLSALADDTRLQILKSIADQGEMRSQEVMDQLELSQSASSRHLKQLSATGYLAERRCEGAKCYSIVPERVENTLQAVRNYLLGTG